MSIESTIARAFAAAMKPKPIRTVSEHSDMFARVVQGPERGRWSTDRTPYLRWIMDRASDAETNQITLMCASQVGKTAAMLNMLQYFIEAEPSSMIFVMPKREAAVDFVKERLEPRILETPSLAEVMGTEVVARSDAAARRRSIQETMLRKHFAGGFVSFVGSNSPADLASRAVRVVFLDEYDRMEDTREGDPLYLARRRTDNFGSRRKIIVSSTPTDTATSRIYREWQRSSQHYWEVPCQHCGTCNVWSREQVTYDTRRDGTLIPETSRHVCPHCDGTIRSGSDTPTSELLATGHIIRRTEGEPGHVGVNINKLYSPWLTLDSIAEEMCRAEREDNPERRREAEGVMWGVPYAPVRRELDLPQRVHERRERYPVEVPRDAVVLTAGVDVQADRIECEVVGWGRGRESWGIEYLVLWGDPKQRSVWDQLSAVLDRQWQHESGETVQIALMGIDSGYRTTHVYRFVAAQNPHGMRPRAVALKGATRGKGNPFTSKVMISGAERAARINVDVDQGKAWLLEDWLPLTEPSPGFCHFPSRPTAGYDERYFNTLFSEVRDDRGKWTQTVDRNEGLDVRVYNIAAMEHLDPNFDAWWRHYNEEDASKQAPAPQALPPSRSKRRTRSSSGVRI